MLWSFVALSAVTCFHRCGSQVIRVVDISRTANPVDRFRPSSPRSMNRAEFTNISLISDVSDSSEAPVFQFLRPRGLRIFIPGPYPPSNRYRITFHININKEFDGWKKGDWNEIVIIRYGLPWSYTFPEIQVEQGDTIYYWIEVQGIDWEKGYKGKYEVTQPSPHGNLVASTPCSRTSSTTYTGGKKACAGEQLISSYSRVASKYLRKGATYFMQSVKRIGGIHEDRFTVFTKDNIIWNSTHNAFIPSLLVDKYGPLAVDSNITIKDCTSKEPDLCFSKALGYLILPPVMSGRHSTKQSFSFRYGILEVTAKLPKGDWIVPELWLMPKDEAYGNSSGRIVLAMSRGNAELSDGAEDYSSRVLEAGLEMGSSSKMFRIIQSTPWTNDYHNFKLIWTPERMEFIVDGQEIGQVQPGKEWLDSNLNGTKMAPFDKEFYLVFGVHVGGNKDFPDTLIGKPWKNYEPKDRLKFWNARKNWLKTWSVNSALIIKGLSIRSLEV